MSKAPLRTTLVDGQSYVDEPVYVKPLPVPELERSLGKAFGRPQPLTILVGHERVHLRWMRPDRNGKLVPR